MAIRETRITNQTSNNINLIYYSFEFTPNESSTPTQSSTGENLCYIAIHLSHKSQSS